MKMMNDGARKKGFWGRLTSLAIIVLFVFVILLVSFAAAGGLLFLLIRTGFLPMISERNLLVFLLFMLLVSLSIGTMMAGLGGTLMIRPMRRMIEATKEVRSGNYNVRVVPEGPFEMQRLAVNFNEMAKELASVETLRSDFVNNISHEFKTPVVSVRGFAKLLKKKSLPEEKRDEYLDIIIAEADRMAQLSSNVLLLSKLDSTVELPEKKVFALDEQMRQCVLLVQPQLQRKQQEVMVDCEPVDISGNEEMLQQVWLNLLHNAIKFTPEEGDIRVKVARQGDFASVWWWILAWAWMKRCRRTCSTSFTREMPREQRRAMGWGCRLCSALLL